jgi:hypothetical protein
MRKRWIVEEVARLLREADRDLGNIRVPDTGLSMP